MVAVGSSVAAAAALVAYPIACSRATRRTSSARKTSFGSSSDITSSQDWNCDGQITDVAFPSDLNGDRDRDRLVPFEDWSRLVYDGGLVGALTAPLPAVTTNIEPTVEELEADGLLGPPDSIAPATTAAVSRRALEWAVHRDMYLLPYCVVDSAILAQHDGELDRAATLLASAQAIFDATGAVPDPDDRVEIDACRGELEERMTATAYDTALERGRQLRTDEALKLALGALTTHP